MHAACAASLHAHLATCFHTSTDKMFVLTATPSPDTADSAPALVSPKDCKQRGAGTAAAHRHSPSTSPPAASHCRSNCHCITLPQQLPPCLDPPDAAHGHWGQCCAASLTPGSIHIGTRAGGSWRTPGKPAAGDNACQPAHLGGHRLSLHRSTHRCTP